MGLCQMSGKIVSLREAESLEVICLMDNSVDFTSSISHPEVQGVRSWVVKRMARNGLKRIFACR